MGDVGHNCGWAITKTIHDVHNFGNSIQHRGRDGFGVAGIHGNGVDVLTAVGTIDKFDRNSLQEIFPSSCHTFLIHNRYGTRGSKEKKVLLEQLLHPRTIGGELVEKSDSHEVRRNCKCVLAFNGEISDEHFAKYNFPFLQTDTDTEKLLHLYKKIGAEEIVKRIPGAYTAVIADVSKEYIMVLRDKTGIKPGVLGIKGNKYIAASEDVAFVKNGGFPIEKIAPGSVYHLSSDGGSFEARSVIDSKPNYCFFEGNYISEVGSSFEGLNIRELRTRLGAKLAEEHPIHDADVISFVPRCPEPAAREYAKTLGKRDSFLPIFYKPKSERAFQGPDSEERRSSIEKNLHLNSRVIKEIEGKKVVIIDDSTIRGNNSKWVKHLLYDQAKVKEAVLINYTPPIGIIPEDGIPRGCMFGVDMHPEESDNHQFVARGRTMEGISQVIGMPTLYLSVQGMKDVYKDLGIPPENLCTYCIGGDHPFKDLESKVG